MANRRLLIIGSQCRRLNKLNFLPDVAVRLHELMARPGPGECVSVNGNRPGLLLDPTVAKAKKAIRTAIADAGRTGETLVLAYIGHAEFPDERSGDFYLMPTDATKATSDGAIHFAEFIKDHVKPSPGQGGLVVLLDACYSGVGALQSMERWAQSQVGFELLTATDDRKTANATLSRAVIELLEHGDPETDERIHCRHVHRRLKERNHPAQYVAYNPNDDCLYLGRNVARDPGDVFWKDSPGRAQILKQTEYFQPTPQLAQLAEASRSHPVVVLMGETGTGKSTLAAALARPEITEDLVPDGFAQAVTILGLTTNPRSLADDLEQQLRRSIPEFDGALAEFERSVPLPMRETFDFLHKKVLGPLEHLADQPVVRIVLDGFDQLPDGTRSLVNEALGARPRHLRLIITTRPGSPGCPQGHIVHLDQTRRQDLDAYLASRRVPQASRAAILDKTRDHWLVARLLADAVLANPGIDLARLPNTVNQAYAILLDQAGAADAWIDKFRPVFGALAVAGSGPVLPIPLLGHASKALGGPKDEEAFRDVLAKLRGLVVRRDTGTTGEHVGLFHPTLADYLLGPAYSADYALDTQAAHRAMVKAIEALAPSSEHKHDDPLHRYAFLREADHLWAIGDLDGTLERLAHRASNDPRENLERWRQWHTTIQDQFGKDDEHTLLSAGSIAFWTGEAGDARRALQLCQELLQDRRRVQRPDHPNTLVTRRHIARWTGEAGDAREALRLFQELLPDEEQVLGRDHPDTLVTRHDIAHWTGKAGDAHKALRLCEELLPVWSRVHGRDHLETLGTRHSVAHWAGEAGDAPRALELFHKLLADRRRVQRPDHPDTLVTRHDLARWTGEAGEPREALRLFQELVPEEERVLGPDHPYKLVTRHDIAYWTGQAGDAREALRLFQKLLPDEERVLGRDHPETLKTRHDIAHWTGQAGARKALRLLRKLLQDQEGVVGRDHPDTLDTLLFVGSWAIQAGERTEGCQRLLEGLMRAEGRFGPDHTLTRRFKAALRDSGYREPEQAGPFMPGP